MRPPWFPVPLDICRANITCHDFRASDVLTPREGVTIRTGSLNHPGNCIGYRVEWGGRAVALISDTEHVHGVLDANVLELIENADLVIYDSTYHRRGDGALPRLRPFDLAAGHHAVRGGGRQAAGAVPPRSRRAPTASSRSSRSRQRAASRARSPRATGR